MTTSEALLLADKLQASLRGRIMIRIYAKGNSMLIFRPEMSDEDAAIKIAEMAFSDKPKATGKVAGVEVYANLKKFEIPLISFTFLIELLVNGEIINPIIKIKIFKYIPVGKVHLKEKQNPL